MSFKPPYSPLSRTTLELLDIVEHWSPPAWYPMALYSEPAKASAAFYKEILGWNSDKSGIYFFRTKSCREFNQHTGLAIKRRLFYVGRAGKIARRLNRHLQVVSANSASLVYKITAQALNRTHIARNTNMQDEAGFRRHFVSNQAFLRDTCEMSYFECQNDYRQALLEILFSLRFRTPFNEWKTH